MALRLSEAEFAHAMKYLKNKGIHVVGKGATLDGEFENYHYITTYKSGSLPLSVSAEETLENIKKYKETNDPMLREKIIEDNTRLVPYIASRYVANSGFDKSELESFGYEGLVIALENFDISRGNTFASYAIPCIRNTILTGINEMQMEAKKFYYDYVSAKNAIEKDNGMTLSEDPSLIEDVLDLLIAHGKISEKNRDYDRMRIQRMVFGNESLSDEDNVERLTSSGQLVNSHDYAEEVLNSTSREKLEELMRYISEKDSPKKQQEKVLRMRYGFDGPPKTREEVGKEMKVSGERIRRIEARALRNLRHPLRNPTIKDYCDFETEKYKGKSF